MTRRATGRFSKIRDGMHFSGCSFGADLREARCPDSLVMTTITNTNANTKLCNYAVMHWFGDLACLKRKSRISHGGTKPQRKAQKQWPRKNRPRQRTVLGSYFSFRGFFVL